MNRTTYNIISIPFVSSIPAPHRSCCRYVQPEVAKSFKPCPVYKRPTAQIDSTTIYQNSYFPMCPAERVQPMRPTATLTNDHNVKMDTLTVQQLSYPGHQCPERQPIIPPCDHSMLGSGPMQDMTTQRHDYVQKCAKRPPLMHPVHSILTPCAPMQKETVHQLSFLAPGCVPKVESFRPCVVYQRPNGNNCCGCRSLMRSVVGGGCCGQFGRYICG